MKPIIPVLTAAQPSIDVREGSTAPAYMMEHLQLVVSPSEWGSEEILAEVATKGAISLTEVAISVRSVY